MARRSDCYGEIHKIACGEEGSEFPLEAVPLLHCLLEGVPHDGILFLGWVGYPYAEDIVDESFVEGDMLGPLREEGVFV